MSPWGASSGQVSTATSEEFASLGDRRHRVRDVVDASPKSLFRHDKGLDKPREQDPSTPTETLEILDNRLQALNDEVSSLQPLLSPHPPPPPPNVFRCKSA